MRSPLVVVATLAAVLAAGAGLRSAALHAGFWSDDYLHFAMLNGQYPLARAPHDLFRFADGSAADMRALIDFGYYPYWSQERFQLSMLRPLPSLLHALDHAVLGLDALDHHVHSFLWWGLCVIAAGVLLLTVLPRPTALLATAFFALEEAHTVPLVWLSNRSVLMAMAFSCFALAAHVSHRRAPSVGKRVTSLVCFALAVASGEYAIAALGYLFVFEWMHEGSLRDRLRNAAPALGLGVLVVLSHSVLGYGSAHSGLYANPLGAPLAYAQHALVGVPVLAADLLFGMPADLYTFGGGATLPNGRALHVAAGVLALGLAALGLRALRRALPTAEARTVTWLALAALLSLLPVLSSFISTRLLLPAAVGASALLASLVVATLSRLRSPGWVGRLAAFALCALILYTHGAKAAQHAFDASQFYAYIARSRTAWPLSAALDDAKIAQQTVVLVASADANDAAYLPFVRALHGRPMPAHLRILSAAPSPHEVRRLDANTLELTVLDPSSLRGTVAGSLTREAAAPLPVGSLLRIAGMSVAIMEVHEGQPRRVRVAFDVPLESPSMVFLQSTVHGLVPFVPPPVGQRVLVPAPQLPDLALLGRAAAVGAIAR